MRKPKLMELDFLRAAAIVAVLVIHGTASATELLTLGTRTHMWYVMANKLSYFPVQLFVLLSGLVLFYRYSDQWNWRVMFDYYRKRLQYIVLPYIVWSILYMYFNQWAVRAPLHWDMKALLNSLPWGEAHYHLYFMTIIIQLYILFPLLMSLVHWLPLVRRYLWLFAVVAQTLFFLYADWTNWTVPHSDRLFVTYLSLFCFGASIGMYYTKVVAWLERNIWWVPALAMVAGFLMLVLNLQGRYGMSTNEWEFKLLFNSYPLLLALTMIWIGRRLWERFPRLAAWTVPLGAASFGIYLIHPMLMHLQSIYVPAVPYESGYNAITIGSTIVVFFVSWGMIAAIKWVKGSWVILGK